MSDHVDVVVPLRYRASVIPKGGRLPRTHVFLVDVPVRIRKIDSRDMPVAVVSQDRHLANREYRSHEGRLWMPVRSGPASDHACLEAEEVLAAIATGVQFTDDRWVENPFRDLASAKIGGGHFVNARPIEEMLLREVVRDERAETTARAHRLANDFMVDEQGRVLRYTSGPVWMSYNTWSIEADPSLESPPRGVATAFHATRKDDAYDFLRRHYGKTLSGFEARGSIEVVDVSTVPDLDVWNAALALFAREAFPWTIVAAASGSGDFEQLGERVATAYEALIGVDRDVLIEDGARWQAPFDDGRPDDVRIRGFVEDLRLFVAELPKEVPAEHRDLWPRSEPPTKLDRTALARWDEYEAPKFAALEAPPSLDDLSGFQP